MSFRSKALFKIFTVVKDEGLTVVGISYFLKSCYVSYFLYNHSYSYSLSPDTSLLSPIKGLIENLKFLYLTQPHILIMKVLCDEHIKLYMP